MGRITQQVVEEMKDTAKSRPYDPAAQLMAPEVCQRIFDDLYVILTWTEKSIPHWTLTIGCWTGVTDAQVEEVLEAFSEIPFTHMSSPAHVARHFTAFETADSQP